MWYRLILTAGLKELEYMINKNSNQFTMIFASVMVVVVAVLLASAAIQLGHLQKQNERI